MIAASAALARVLTGSHTRRVRVTSSLAGVDLGEVPVQGGGWTVDGSLSIPERLTLEVPRFDAGRDWWPGAVLDHPLAPWGQRLVLEVGVDVGRVTEWLTFPPVVVHTVEMDEDGQAIRVEAQGLLTLLQEALLLAPITSSAWCSTTIRTLVADALPTRILAPDAKLPPTTWEEDRLGAIEAVLDAWPASARVVTDGTLEIDSDRDPTSAVATLTDGRAGVAVGTTGRLSRESVVTMVKASGDFGLSALSRDVDPTSPGRYDGPFNPLPVPDLHSNSLLLTPAQCQDAADKRLRELRREGLVKTISMIPDPRIEVGDGVSVTDYEWSNKLCVVTSINLPLLGSGGNETITVRAVDV